MSGHFGVTRNGIGSAGLLSGNGKQNGNGRSCSQDEDRTEIIIRYLALLGSSATRSYSDAVSVSFNKIA